MSAEQVINEALAAVEVDETLKPLLVAPERAAHLLDLSESVVYQLLNTGEIASFKVGRRRCIPVAALHEWIERKLKEGQ